MSADVTVTLSGDALYGLAPTSEMRGLVAPLPQTVRLGRLRPKSRPLTLRLENFVDLAATTPKSSVDWYTKAQASIARMYLNDRYGDCVIAGKGHALGVWSANDPDSTPGGETVLATDQEIYDQYQGVCGRGDNGCYIPDVLNYMVSKGFTAGGKKYQLDGYVSADWRSKELVQIGLDLFGCACIGINLPSAWTSDAVWDVTNTRVVGGHDVTPCGYGANVLGTTADGVVIASWGRLYLITWKAWVRTDWLEELYFMVPSFLWTGADKRAPSGVDLATLKDDLAKMKDGTIPPLPDPTPPPVPPVPPTPVPPGPTPVPPVGQVVNIPELAVKILGVTLGHTVAVSVPVTAGSSGGGELQSIPWFVVLQDAIKLAGDVIAQDWAAVLSDVAKLVSDFTSNQAALDAHFRRLSAGPAGVAWLQLFRDVQKLVADFRANAAFDVLIADAKAIARDLGFDIP